MKIKLAFMTNDAARKRTYKKRIVGLKKKMDELSTLCGVDACAIVYSPYESHPQLWPNCTVLKKVLARFLHLPAIDQCKNMLNQESYISQRIKKAKEDLKKKIKENREKEMTNVMYQCLDGKLSLANLSLKDLNFLGGLVDQKLLAINSRVESLLKETSLRQQQQQPWMIDNFEMMVMRQNPKSFMDLIMGSE